MTKYRFSKSTQVGHVASIIRSGVADYLDNPFELPTNGEFQTPSPRAFLPVGSDPVITRHVNPLCTMYWMYY